MKKLDAAVAVILAVTVVGCCTIGIKATRESAAQVQCVNNLKQVGLAIHNFHDSNRKLPRATATPPTDDFPPDKQISWLWSIHMFIEARMDPKYKVDVDKTWDDPINEYVVTSQVFVYVCPANPNSGTNQNFSHYIGIAGVGKESAWLPLNDAKAGVFGYQRTLTFKDIANADGTSTTMMVAETCRDNGPWAMGGYTTVRGIDQNEPAYFDADGQFFSNHRSSWFTSATVTTVAMADASVRKLTNRVPDNVIEALATYAGAEEIRDADLDR